MIDPPFVSRVASRIYISLIVCGYSLTTIAVFYASQAIGSAEMSRLELIGSKAKIMFLRLKFNKNGVSGLSESNKVESWNSATVPITQY